jgi:hypothetical protein
MKPQNLPALTWDETDQKASIGPGQSRPIPGVETEMYRLTVKPVDGQKMRVLLPAESADRAVLYAENRWPGAIVSDAERVK